jgi:hypothetical protein
MDAHPNTGYSDQGDGILGQSRRLRATVEPWAGYYWINEEGDPSHDSQAPARPQRFLGSGTPVKAIAEHLGNRKRIITAPLDELGEKMTMGGCRLDCPLDTFLQVPLAVGATLGKAYHRMSGMSVAMVVPLLLARLY